MDHFLLPRVFNTDTVTVCLNQENLCLYIGHLDIKYIRKLEVKYENNKAFVDVSFMTSHEPEVAMLIEGASRLVKTIPWIRVSP